MKFKVEHHYTVDTEDRAAGKMSIVFFTIKNAFCHTAVHLGDNKTLYVTKSYWMFQGFVRE